MSSPSAAALTTVRRSPRNRPTAALRTRHARLRRRA
jgi:hypothetical protein